MSFTADVKAELCHIPIASTEGRLALLAGFLRFGQAADLGGGRGAVIALPSSHTASARLAFRLVVERSASRPELLLKSGGSRGPRFEILFRDRRHFATLSRRLALTTRRSLPRFATSTAQGRRHFLRGVFLAVGSVSPPSRPPHLELLLPGGPQADLVAGVMAREHHAPLVDTPRAAHVRLYLKSRESVASFLRDVGASQALFAFEDARAMRELRDRVNRQVNAETANLEKTLRAALVQEKAFRELIPQAQFARLPPKLRELARLRIAHPTASLAELGERLGISKSGVNGRMRRLMRLLAGDEVAPGRQRAPHQPMERRGRKR